MGDKHVVRFEPVGIEIEVDEEQTVLRAAAEQGIMLMHGCKEGQCAACKSFVLDGDDIELDRYSTFALPDFEQEEGYTLLCRAHVYEDVTIELLNYDEEMIRSGLPIQTVHGRGGLERARHPRHAPPGPASWWSPPSCAFFPGQYVDITVPGTETTRSFSMANTSTQGERAARVRHPGLPRRRVLPASWTPSWPSATGSTSSARSGSFTLREGRDVRPGVRRRRRRDGADPVACCASLAEQGQHPQGDLLLRRPPPAGPVLREGAVRARGARCPTSASSRRSPSRDEEAVGRRGRPDHRRRQAVTRPTSRGVDSYVCGPPPMVEAAMEVLGGLGAPEKHIYYDKFTTTGTVLIRPRKRGGSAMTTTTGAQSSPKPRLHRRRGRRQGVPRLDARALQLLHADRSASSRTTRTSPSRCSPTRGTT